MAFLVEWPAGLALGKVAWVPAQHLSEKNPGGWRGCSLEEQGTMTQHTPHSVSAQAGLSVGLVARSPR